MKTKTCNWLGMHYSGGGGGPEGKTKTWYWLGVHYSGGECDL